MARPKQQPLSVIVKIGDDFLCTIVRPAQDWQAAMLDFTAVIQRHFKVSDDAIIRLLEESGPAAVAAKEILDDIKERTTGCRYLPPRRRRR